MLKGCSSYNVSRGYLIPSGSSFREHSLLSGKCNKGDLISGGQSYSYFVTPLCNLLLLLVTSNNYVTFEK